MSSWGSWPGRCNLAPSVRLPYFLVMAGLVGGCDLGPLLTGQDCTESAEQTFDIDTPAPPSMQLKIDSCRVDVDACGALCTRVMEDHGLATNIAFPPGMGGIPDQGFGQDFVPYTKCAVTFDGGTAHVDVAYDQFNGGDNCPVFDQAGTGVAGGVK
jgi:hypothetical protein